jgi:hypothetical protein
MIAPHNRILIIVWTFIGAMLAGHLTIWWFS